LTRPHHLAKLPRVPGESEWTAVHVEVSAATADAVANFLTERGAAGVLSDDVTPSADRVRLEAHMPKGQSAAVVAALERYLGELTRIDATWTAGPVGTTPVPAVDWESVFRAHHTPITVGSRLLVAPPWDVPSAAGREVLVIEPGMAFGTGQHATTRTCLEEIDALVGAGTVQSALDVGTGSGVLAAALARLGVAFVVALDCDPAVLPLARANCDRNQARDVALFAGTVAAVRARFDLVVANILADTLVAEARALAASVAAGGDLVLSGILADQVPQVLGAFPGWRPARVRADDAWRTLRLVRKAS
jgi:ribosomal protein L11 methyltransferase